MTARAEGHVCKRRSPTLVQSAFVLNAKNLSARVVHGASFVFLGILLRTLITVGSVAVLARLLTPEAFGYIAMAAVITEFAALLGGFGFGNILIQRRVVTRLQMDTVFWASAVIGACLAALVFTLSFVASWLFSEPLTGQLLRLLCLPFLLNGLSTVHEAVIARLMRFRTEFWIQIVAVTNRALAAIVFAHLGFGVWSLVVGALAGSLSSLILNWLAVPYMPRLRYHGSYLTSTWHTNVSYLGHGFVYYASVTLDLALIGRSLGASALGYYQTARSLTDEIRARIAIPLQRVLFPAFSSIQFEHARLQEAVMRAGRLLSAVVIPIGVGLAAVAEELVPVLYGDQWTAMIPLLRVLGLSAAIRAATAIASPIFSAQNRVGLALAHNVVGVLVLLVGVTTALPYGVDWVALAVLVSSLYAFVPFRVGLALIGMRTTHAVQILGCPLIAAFLMWSSIQSARIWIDYSQKYAAAVLFGYIALGAVIYGLTLHLLSREYLRELRGLAQRWSANKRM